MACFIQVKTRNATLEKLEFSVKANISKGRGEMARRDQRSHLTSASKAILTSAAGSCSLVVLVCSFTVFLSSSLCSVSFSLPLPSFLLLLVPLLPFSPSLRISERVLAEIFAISPLDFSTFPSFFVFLVFSSLFSFLLLVLFAFVLFSSLQFSRPSPHPPVAYRRF